MKPKYRIKRFKGPIALGILVCVPCLASATPKLELTPETPEYSLTPHLEILESDRQLTISDVAGPEFDSQFRPAGTRTPSFGMTRSEVWARFTVTEKLREKGDPPTQWLLDVQWPFLSIVTLYKPSAVAPNLNRWETEQTGQLAVAPYATSRLMAFELPTNLHAPQTFYLHVQSDAAIILPLKIYSETAYRTDMNRRILWYGMLYGIFLAIVLYNLVIYSSLKDRIHIWFALSLIFAGLYLVECDALTPAFWHASGLSPLFRHLLLLGLIMTFGYFVRQFMKAERVLPVADKLVTALIAAAAVGLVLTPWMPLHFLMKYDSWLGLAAPLAFVPPALFQWRRGFSPARFFLLGWVGIALLGFVDVLVLLAVLPYTRWILSALQVGAIVVALQFSHAVGYRIRILREKNEQALRESEETFRALAENSPDVIARFDANGRINYVSPVVEQQLGVTPGDMTGKDLRQAGFPDALVDLANQAVARIFTTKQPVRLEVEFPQGHWADWQLVPILDPAGHAVAGLASSRDLTERVQAEKQRRLLEAQLSQAQKMESIGRLAGGVAHDFNNLLMPIIGYTEMLLSEGHDLSPDVIKQLQAVKEAGERARELTRQLLAFGRKQVLQMENLDLNTLVANFSQMLRRLIGEDIQMHLILEPSLPTVKADQTQVEQVLLNLAVNSRDAMPNGGRITIETANARFDETCAAALHEVPPGQYVLLSVSDTGCGMAPDVQKMVFEPFFTTKGPGEGTGLGLATVYGIVKQHRGHVSLYSEPGQGTTFKIYLPQSTDAAVKKPPEPGKTPLLRGNETVLLVEDDRAVRKLTNAILSELGYTVIEVSGGNEAIQAANDAGRIDLLLTDVIMPEMSGREVYDRLVAANPGLKALYMSGYPSDILAHHGTLEEGIHLLQKPFTREGLAQKVREVLSL